MVPMAVANAKSVRRRTRPSTLISSIPLHATRDEQGGLLGDPAALVPRCGELLLSGSVLAKGGAGPIGVAAGLEEQARQNTLVAS